MEGTPQMWKPRSRLLNSQENKEMPRQLKCTVAEFDNVKEYFSGIVSILRTVREPVIDLKPRALPRWNLEA